VEKTLEIIEDQIGKSLAGSIRKTFGDNNFGDTMIVGGGISGVQAALDLGNAGFKVYLVDQSPSIGGKMAQLDKTFPTNECSI
jgi:heterodisulfide reductase subunit A